MKKVFLFTFFCLSFVLFLHPPSLEGDFYHHLNTGKYVYLNHSLPHKDQYTFTLQGKEWIGYGWGTGLIFYLIFRYFENAGVSTFVSLIAISTLAIFYYYLRSLKVSFWVRMLSLLLMAGLMSFRFPLRPEIINYPMVVLLLLIDQKQKSNPKLALFYPVLILIWTNTYGAGVILGLGLLGLFGIKQLILDHFKWRKHLLVYSCILFAIPCSLINGYGLKSLLYLFYIPQVRITEGEWAGIFQTLHAAPSSYLEIFKFWLLGYTLFLLFFLFLIVKMRSKIRQYPFISFLSLAIFVPIFTFRQLPLATVLSIPLLAILLNQAKNKLVIVLFSSLAIILIVISVLTNPPGLGSQDSQNMDLINFIKKNHLQGNIFNNQAIGAYLTYYLYPENKVSYDTRDDLFLGSQFLKDLHSSVSILPLLKKYPVDLVVTSDQSRFYQYLFQAQGWKIVYIKDGYLIAIPIIYSTNSSSYR